MKYKMMEKKSFQNRFSPLSRIIFCASELIEQQASMLLVSHDRAIKIKVQIRRSIIMVIPSTAASWAAQNFLSLKSDLLIGKTSHDRFDFGLVILALIPLPSFFSFSIDALLSASFSSPLNFSSNLDFSRFFGKIKNVLLK